MSSSIKEAKRVSFGIYAGEAGHYSNNVNKHFYCDFACLAILYMRAWSVPQGLCFRSKMSETLRVVRVVTPSKVTVNALLGCGIEEVSKRQGLHKGLRLNVTAPQESEAKGSMTFTDNLLASIAMKPTTALVPQGDSRMPLPCAFSTTVEFDIPTREATSRQDTRFFELASTELKHLHSYAN